MSEEEHIEPYCTAPPSRGECPHVSVRTEIDRLAAIIADAEQRLDPLRSFERACDDMYRLGYSGRQIRKMVGGPPNG